MSKYPIPSVLLSADANQAQTTHKIHILGDDARSKFIAHALSGVYASVELLGHSARSQKGYSNILKPGTSWTSPEAQLERNTVQGRLVQGKDETADKSRIDQLIMTDIGPEVVRSLDQVKHRVDENTTICLLGDGLGVLEDVKQRIFTPERPTPKFVLGHMSHKIVHNRKTKSAKLLKGGELRLTDAGIVTQSASNFMDVMRQPKALRGRIDNYDTWLINKLPSVIFGSVVEPVCVAFDLSYASLQRDYPARRLMQQLLSEVLMVVQGLPEFSESEYVQNCFRREAVQLELVRHINAKRNAPSDMVMRMRRGLPMNIDYLNGYFVRRAHHLGIGMRMNRLIRDLVKVKHSSRMEQLNSHIPIEETSVPSDQSYRYRTTFGSPQFP